MNYNLNTRFAFIIGVSNSYHEFIRGSILSYTLREFDRGYQGKVIYVYGFIDLRFLESFIHPSRIYYRLE
jgi:hypothetical protein